MESSGALHSYEIDYSTFIAKYIAKMTIFQRRLPTPIFDVWHMSQRSFQNMQFFAIRNKNHSKIHFGSREIDFQSLHEISHLKYVGSEIDLYSMASPDASSWPT